MDKSFYDLESPDEAMCIYLALHDNLYDKIKEKVIGDVLLKTFRADGLRAKKILEIGCGGGIFTKFFIENGAIVTCVDTCEPILEKIKDLYPKANCTHADAATVKLEDAGEYDLVFAKDILEHIEDDRGLLRNMNAHLNKDGLILVSTQNSFSLNYLIQGGYHKLRGNHNWFGWDPTHVRFYNWITLRQALTIAGFEPISTFGSYYFPYRLLADKLGDFFESKVFCLLELLGIYKVFPLSITGWNIGVVAKKNG